MLCVILNAAFASGHQEHREAELHEQRPVALRDRAVDHPPGQVRRHRAEQRRSTTPIAAEHAEVGRQAADAEPDELARAELAGRQRAVEGVGEGLQRRRDRRA